MEQTKKERKPIARFFAGREMRYFWVFPPFLILVVGVASAYLPISVTLVIAVLLLVVGVVVFLSTRRVTILTTKTTTQGGEIQSIISLVDDALISYDQNLSIKVFNQAAESLFGIPAQSVLGKVIKPQDAEKAGSVLLVQVFFPSLAQRMIPRSAAGEYPQIVDLSFEEPHLELRAVTSRIAGPDGSTRGFLKIIKNRTREVEIIRSKNEFITIASHQLRTPINELKWAFETLGKDETIADDSRTILENAAHSAERMGVLVDDLLDVARIEEGRFGYKFVVTNIVEFLGNLAAQALPNAERAGIKLYFAPPREELPSVMVDSTKLSVVVSNLLDNAMRYNIEGGDITLTVRAREDEPFVEIAVKDSGIGIPRDEAKKIFTKFFRSSNAVKFNTEGSGLGLYIAKNIIEAHGGRIWLESEQNRGSVFYFTLPTDPGLVPPSEPTIE